MKPTPLLLRLARSGHALVLLVVGILTIGGLAALLAHQRELSELLNREAIREAELDRQLAPLLRREEKRMDISQAVIEGWLPLADAAARFRELNRERDALKQNGGNTTDQNVEEASCREVIVYVGERLLFSPKRAEVLERLERQLKRYRAVPSDSPKK